VSLVKVIEHGDDVHRLQQPLPSLLLQTVSTGFIIIMIIIMITRIVINDQHGDKRYQ
jgi:hypothetical protein